MLDRFKSVMKIIGCSFAIGFCTLTGISGGILTWQGYEKQAEAVDAYKQTEEYAQLRVEEDERLEAFKTRVEEIEVSYKNGEVTTAQYEQMLDDYQEEVKVSNEDFASKALEKSDRDDLKGIIKSGHAMASVGITLCVLSGVALILKGVSSFFIYDGGFGDYYTFNHAMIGNIAEAADDLSDLRSERLERKKARQQEKQEMENERDGDFSEEGDEELGNIEDTCYRE